MPRTRLPDPAFPPSFIEPALSRIEEELPPWSGQAEALVRLLGEEEANPINGVQCVPVVESPHTNSLNKRRL